MHIPDGFIDGPTSLAAGAVAAGGIAVALRKAAEDSLESRAVMTGLVAAFVFAAQMLNFPVASGTPGHLLGGLLAAVLVGPWLGSLAITVVLVMQCLLFADGGISALGLNIINMAFVPAFVPAFVAYGLFLAARKVLPATHSGVLGASRFASSEPDGLEKVAAEHGLDIHEQPHALGDTTFAGYRTAAAGVLGVLVTFSFATAAVWLAVKVRGRARGLDQAATPP